MSANLHPKNPQWQWSCGLCKRDHALKTCRRFLDASADERYDVVVMQHYCINCLARSHLVKDCKNEFGCRVCTKRHNTLLHDAPQLHKPKDSKQPLKKPSTRTQMTQTNNTDPFSWPSVFIPTATVSISATQKDENGFQIRALVNPSITTTKISSSTVRKLGLTKQNHQGREFASISLRARNNKGKFSKQVLALLAEDLPRRPYNVPIKEDPFEEFCDDTVADIDPRSNTMIDMEIGADIYPYIRRDGVIELEMGHVIAQKTALGYVFSGPAKRLY